MLKQRDSLQLNAVRGSGGSEAPSVVVQEDSSPGSGPPEAEAFCTFTPTILKMVIGNACSDV